MNTENILKKIPLLNGGSSRFLSMNRPLKIRYRFLRGLKERYEVHHGVRITDGAIVAAAQLSHRYISDRFLPDKAIDLVDEAASKLRIEIDSMPEELDEVERRIKQLEIEREAVKREKDDESTDTAWKRLNKELGDLNQKRIGLRRTGRLKKS